MLSRDLGARARAPARARRSLIEGDVHDGAFLRAALDGADAVVNLVGILNEQGDDGRGFHRAHVELTEHADRRHASRTACAGCCR